jgi:hypothetical protein
MRRFAYLPYPHHYPSSIFQFVQMNTKRGWEQSKIYKHRKRVDLMALLKDISKSLINCLCTDGD